MNSLYLPLPKRVMAILHLVFALSCAIWLITDPFMGNHFRLKNQLLLIQNLKGDESLSEKLKDQDVKKLELNRERYLKLSSNDKEEINRRHFLVENQMNQPVIKKVLGGIFSFLFETPVIKMAWIILSIGLCILCLKQSPIAMKLTILLPFLVVLYGFSLSQGKPLPPSLYPTEDELVREYIKHPLSPDLSVQKEELLAGWDKYLIHNFTREIPSKNPAEFAKQKEAGEYNFNLTLFKRGDVEPRPSLFALILYFVWNLALALTMNRFTTKLQEDKPQSL